MSKENKYTGKKQLRNFLKENDNYIDNLESGIECLEEIVESLDKENDELLWVVEDQDRTNTELIGKVAIVTNDAMGFVKEIDSLEEDNDYLTGLLADAVEDNEDLNTILQSKQDEIDDWHRYAEELEEKLERQSYLNSFKDKEVVMSKNELVDESVEHAIEEGIKRRKKLCFMAFKDMLKKNPNVKNHVAAEELGVTLETIIKLKCIVAGQEVEDDKPKYTGTNFQNFLDACKDNPNATSKEIAILIGVSMRTIRRYRDEAGMIKNARGFHFAK